MIIWFFSIPVWIFLIVITLLGAFWDAFGEGITFVINLLLLLSIFASVFGFFGTLYSRVTHTSEESWGEDLKLLLFCGIWGFFGICYLINCLVSGMRPI